MEKRKKKKEEDDKDKHGDGEPVAVVITEPEEEYIILLSSTRGSLTFHQVSCCDGPLTDGGDLTGRSDETTNGPADDFTTQ